MIDIDFQRRTSTLLMEKINEKSTQEFYNHIMQNYFGSEKVFTEFIRQCSDTSIMGSESMFQFLRTFYLIGLHTGYVFAKDEDRKKIILV